MTLELCYSLLCLLSLFVKLSSSLFGLSSPLFGRKCPIIRFFCLMLSFVLHPLGFICQLLHFFLESGVVGIVVFLVRMSRCNLFVKLIMKVPQRLLFLDNMFDFISRVKTTAM